MPILTPPMAGIRLFSIRKVPRWRREVIAFDRNGNIIEGAADTGRTSQTDAALRARLERILESPEGADIWWYQAEPAKLGEILRVFALSNPFRGSKWEGS